jgi:hypothetical protein
MYSLSELHLQNPIGDLEYIHVCLLFITYRFIRMDEMRLTTASDDLRWMGVNVRAPASWGRAGTATSS